MMSMEKGQTEADVDFIRHSVLNSLRMYRMKYNDEYGELVICCDDRNSWRREHFPYYKAGRKTGRDASPLNWTQIFECFHINLYKWKMQRLMISLVCFQEV